MECIKNIGLCGFRGIEAAVAHSALLQVCWQRPVRIPPVTGCNGTLRQLATILHDIVNNLSPVR